jgi:polyhydroxyalkanoate synthesis repressor PhaR
VPRRAKRPPSKTAKRPRGRPPKRPIPVDASVDGATHVIKKYGNRRLYDHKLKRATTTDDIAELVKRGVDVRVIDGDTGADITKRVLVQVILEQQNAILLDLLPLDFLKQLVAARDAPYAAWLGQYLATGADWIRRQAKFTPDGAFTMTDFWPWMQRAPTSDVDDDTTLKQRLDDLREQMRDLASRVGKKS